MPDSKVRSSKGFVAIDLDGTTLVQKFDKHKLYGLTHSRSDLRQSLLQYAKMAQNNGYDVVIMTARPEWIETCLLNPGKGYLGTKPTHEIVDALQKEGIHICDIVRVPPKGVQEGLKGKAMQQLLQQYIAQGAQDARGILFDDQLKQTLDVKQQKHSRLIAYDINSYDDKVRFIESMNGSPCGIPELKSNTGKIITQLRQAVSHIDDTLHARECIILNKVLNNLATRLEEVEACGYQPDIEWINHAIKGVDQLTRQLSQKPAVITHEDIAQLSTLMLGTNNPAHFVPNSKCERTIKKLLIYMERLPAREGIKHQCIDYQTHLKCQLEKKQTLFPLNAHERLNTKLDAVDLLIAALTDEPDPTRALKAFQKIFQENAATLKSSRSGCEFVTNIRMALARIPVLGYLFKIPGEKLVNYIDDTYARYPFSETSHFKKNS